MKEILTTAISNTVGLPLLGRTIDFIRDNVKEQTTSLAYSELNSSNDSLPIVLYGCIGTYSTVGFTNDTYTITKGAILYQGEIYQVPAMVATRANVGETIVFRIDSNTFQAGEPTLYTDGASRNTNLDRTIKIYNGATGSGIVDAVNLKHFNMESVDFTQIIGVNSSIFNQVLIISGSISTGYNIQNGGTLIKKGNTITLNGRIRIQNSTGSSKQFNDLTLEFMPYFKNGGLQNYIGTASFLVDIYNTAGISIIDSGDFVLNPEISIDIAAGAYLYINYNISYNIS
jgi:hypothetical protein